MLLNVSLGLYAMTETPIDRTKGLQELSPTTTSSRYHPVSAPAYPVPHHAQTPPHPPPAPHSQALDQHYVGPPSFYTPYSVPDSHPSGKYDHRSSRQTYTLLS
jgi:hypothetical protein